MDRNNPLDTSAEVPDGSPGRTATPAWTADQNAQSQPSASDVDTDEEEELREEDSTPAPDGQRGQDMPLEPLAAPAPGAADGGLEPAPAAAAFAAAAHQPAAAPGTTTVASPAPPAGPQISTP